MTGEKDRFTTVEKLWKLDDETLKTPEHDELCLMLLNKEFIKTRFPPEDPQWYSNWPIEKYEKKYLDMLDKGETKTYDNIFGVYNHDSVTIDRLKGVIDCYYNGKKLIETNTDFNIMLEVPIKGKNGFIIGYWDAVIVPKPQLIEGYNRTERKQFIEVKPRISSFGATLRQLKTYATYINNTRDSNSEFGKIYLFTPDIRYKEAFESQGIIVVSP